MPLLRVKRKWTKKPRRQVEIDWSNPISKGLVEAVLFVGGKPQTLIHKENVITATGTPVWSAGLTGIRREYDAADFESIPDHPDYKLTGAMSALVTINSNVSQSDANWRMIFSKRTPAGSTAEFALNFQNSSSTMQWHWADGSFRIVSASQKVPTNKDVTYLATRNAATDGVLYKDGVSIGTGSALGSAATTTVGINFAAMDVGNEETDASYYVFYLWDRSLSPAEARSISLNQWQLLKPRKIGLPVSAVTGITGTSTTTNNEDTSNASGTLEASGNSATTNNEDTSNASGTLEASGNAVTINNEDVSNATGIVGLDIVGTSITTNADDTSNAVGILENSGTSVTTNDGDVSNAAGVVGTLITGISETTNVNDVSNASGTLETSGNAVTINNEDVSNATGIVGVVTGVTGTSAAANDNDFSRSSGIVGVLEPGKIIKITHFNRNFKASHPDRMFKLTHYNRVFKVIK